MKCDAIGTAVAVRNGIPRTRTSFAWQFAWKYRGGSFQSSQIQRANTLRDVIRRHPDFPVLQGGSNGIPYEFDADACAEWWRDHAAKIEEAEEARRAQLDMWRAELFGKDAAAEDADTRSLTPAERKAELEAQILEDKLRRARGELIDRASTMSALSTAIVELRNELMQIPAELARKADLEREDRIALEEMIERRLNGLARKLADLEFYANNIDEAA